MYNELTLMKELWPRSARGEVWSVAEHKPLVISNRTILQSSGGAGGYYLLKSPNASDNLSPWILMSKLSITDLSW